MSHLTPLKYNSHRIEYPIYRQIDEKNAYILLFDLKESDFKNKFNVVVSDLSPKTSGIKFMDAGRSLEMAEKAFEIAEKVLRPGGNFVCKIFKNELSDEFFGQMKNYFDFAQRFKPKAVIKKSKELYMIGKGFRI